MSSSVSSTGSVARSASRGGVTLTLADRMKQATALLHQKAERTGVVQDMLRKTVSLECYRLYLHNLLHVYEGIEQKPDAALAVEHQVQYLRISSFIDKRLLRACLIRADLKIMADRFGPLNMAVLESAKCYRRDIDNARLNDPVTLLGHLYVRYLGDLNGGQMLARLMSASLNLPDEALGFYRFSSIVDIKQLRADYRARFDDFDADDQEVLDITATAVRAFEFNIALSREVGKCMQTES